MRLHKTWLLALPPLLALGLIYVPDVGRGFLRDDFDRILDGRAGDVFFRDNGGWYRPLISVSFALSEWAFGLDSRAYGLTNLALLAAVMVAIAGLTRALGLAPPAAALVAALLWAFNPHGINMALLWISGRTSLLLLLFAVPAAAAFARDRRLLAAVLLLLAMMCKEEAVPLPFVLALWAGYSPGASPSWSLRRAAGRSWPLLLSVVAYFGLRATTAAVYPWSAPSFYRYSAAPALLLRNLLEYADRSLTLSAAVALVALLVVRRWPAFDPSERRVMFLGALWLILGHSMTVAIPARSSLYTCSPSVGGALIGAVLLTAIWRSASPTQKRVGLVALTLLPLALVPIYRGRNLRWTSVGDLSSRLVRDLQVMAPTVPQGASLVLEDDPRPRLNLTAVFGTSGTVAFRILTGRRDVCVFVERERRAGADYPPPVIRYALRDGHLQQSPPR